MAAKATADQSIRKLAMSATVSLRWLRSSMRWRMAESRSVSWPKRFPDMRSGKPRLISIAKKFPIIQSSAEAIFGRLDLRARWSSVGLGGSLDVDPCQQHRTDCPRRRRGQGSRKGQVHLCEGGRLALIDSAHGSRLNLETSEPYRIPTIGNNSASHQRKLELIAVICSSWLLTCFDHASSRIAYLRLIQSAHINRLRSATLALIGTNDLDQTKSQTD